MRFSLNIFKIMNQKTYFTVTGLIFLVMAILHAARITYGWEAIINGWNVPLWLSWVAFVVSGYLAYRGLILSTTKLISS